MWMLFEIGAIQDYLESLNPSADSSVANLLDETACYGCLSPGMWSLLELGFLEHILSIYNASADSSVNGLLDDARCYLCYGIPIPLLTAGLISSFSVSGAYPEYLGLVGGGNLELVGGGGLELVNP
jgi:hypothetical protein